MVSAGGKFRFVADPGKPSGRRNGRQRWRVGGLRAGVEPFIEQLAAPTATPGGGSAAAASGAMAAGLANMVAAMSRGKKAYLQHEAALSEAIARLGQLREELKAAIDADAESYNLVMKAYKAAKESSDGDAANQRRAEAGDQRPVGRGRARRRGRADRREAGPDYESQYEVRFDDGSRIGQGRADRRAGECRDQSRIAEGWRICRPRRAKE